MSTAWIVLPNSITTMILFKKYKQQKMPRKKWLWMCSDEKPFKNDPVDLVKTWRKEKSIGTLLLPDLWALIGQYLQPRFGKWNAPFTLTKTTYANKEHKWRTLPPFPSPLRSFFLQLEWSDEGYGDQTGRFKIKLIRDLVVILEETWFNNVAPCNRLLLIMYLTREDNHKSQLLDVAGRNDTLEIWYHVCPGHELKIKHFSVRIEPECLK